MLVGDNQIAIVDGTRTVVERAYYNTGHMGSGHMGRFGKESDDYDLRDEALAADADAVVPDNTPRVTLIAAVAHVDGRALTAAGGRIIAASAPAAVAGSADPSSFACDSPGLPACDPGVAFPLPWAADR